jgi:hypothetical protein
MKTHTGKSLMIGVARDAGIGEIEFEDGAEPIVMHSRVTREHLPRAIQHGSAAAARARSRINKEQNAASTASRK